MSTSDQHLNMIQRARAQIDALGSSSPSSLRTASTALPEIPNYEILREIQRGGQGAVYLCRQMSTRREVALKVLHARDGARPAERVRFQREVEILAALRHPNVVTIHDSGSIGDRFYYAMEYIAGRPLDRFLAEEAPPIRERVRLFAEISAGVGAAHLRGVIHRDLKPGNIRVDEQGRCHVLDFGLARFADDSAALTAPGAMTQTGQFLGSLPWASPEQVAGQRDELDLRTDVYSLGVLLYQALTGRFPYRVTGALSEVVEQIRTVEPVAPSRVTRGLNDELDTIVRKCLAKDRERRYSTAVELASDLRRYLAGEPIEAKRDSLSYLLRRQLRKHWLAVSVGAAFVVTVTGSLIATLSFWRQAVADRARAQRAQGDAENEAAQTKAVLAFLNEEILAAADPENTPGAELTVRDALDAASAALADRFSGEPRIAATIHLTIGESYASLGEYAKADEHLTRAVATLESVEGADGRDVAYGLQQLAALRADQGRHEEEVALCQRVLDYHERTDGALHPDTLLARKCLGEAYLNVGKLAEAETALRAALDGQLATVGARDVATIQTRIVLADLLGRHLNRFDDARPLLDGIVDDARQAWGPQHPEALTTISNYANILAYVGDEAGAAGLLEPLVELKTRVLGPTHRSTLLTKGFLASLYGGDRLPEAEALLRDVVTALQAQLGDDHPNVVTKRGQLAKNLQEQGRLAEAEQILRDVVERQRRIVASNSGARLGPLQSLAKILALSGHPDQAEPLQREFVELCRELDQPERVTLAAISNLADMYRDLGRPEAAGPLRQEAFEAALHALGPDHAFTQALEARWATFLYGEGRLADALPHFRTLVAALAEGDATPVAASLRGSLGDCLRAAGEFAEAEPHMLFSLHTFTADAATDPALIEKARGRLADLYSAWGRPDEAEHYRTSP